MRKNQSFGRIASLSLVGTLASGILMSNKEGLSATSLSNLEASVQNVQVTGSELKKEYRELLQSVRARQQEFQTKYAKASSQERQELIEQSRDYVFETLTEKVFPAWHGTVWKSGRVYNPLDPEEGRTETPRQGSIACGYFVSTTLRDSGFNLERSNLGRQLSKDILFSLLPKKETIRELRNSYPYDENFYFTSEAVRRMESDIGRLGDILNELGEGLYVTGLDNHVGFLINKGGKLTFCNSNYLSPIKSVANENLTDAYPLYSSEYKIIGRILGDEMIKRWLTGEPIKTRITKTGKPK